MPNVLAHVGPYAIGDRQPLLLIAGPCVIENESLTAAIAESLVEITVDRAVSLVFKASFDKANRSRGDSFRGVGIDEGLAILDRIGAACGVPITTDVHTADQVAAAAQVCDLLQIPAFLCRQTDLLLAAGKTGRAVNVKKGQFMAPRDMQHVVDKLRSVDCANILLCERGTFFGYGRLVNDMRGLLEMRGLGVPVVFDATHSAQEPGGPDGVTRGNRAVVPSLAAAAMAVGIDALFLETHPDPDSSPSDAANMIELAKLPDLLDRVLAIREVITNDSSRSGNNAAKLPAEGGLR